MPNTLGAMSFILKEALIELKNTMVFGNVVYKDFSTEYGKRNDLVNIDRPNLYDTQESSDFTVTSWQDTVEKQVSLRLDKVFTTPASFTQKDLAIFMENQNAAMVRSFRERVITPMANSMAQKVDTAISREYYRFYGMRGTRGTPVSTVSMVADAATLMDEMAVPGSGRKYIGHSGPVRQIAGQLALLPNTGKERTAYEEAQIGRIQNFDMLSCPYAPFHLTGAFGGTPVVAAAGQSVTYASISGENQQVLNISGLPNSISNAWRRGDVFTIAGVFAVNPVPGSSQAVASGKAVMPYLQTFTVLDDVTSTGAGLAAVNISPAIITAGPYQTVSAAPAANAVITVLGVANTTYRENIAFVKPAFVMAVRPLSVEQNLTPTTESMNGLSMTFSKSGDINDLSSKQRIDMLAAIKVLDPRLGVRHTN
jgi:hypothetical protein